MEAQSLNQTSIVEAAGHHTSAEVDGEIVILDLEEGIYYGINQVGARIWEIVQDPTPIEEIVETITDEYDVSHDECSRDVISLLHDLKQKNLVVIADD
jgi:hypothetical protein